MFDLVKYISKWNPKPVQGGEWVITCPLCNREKLVVNVEKNLWHCWVCQQYGFKRGKRVPIKGAGNAIQLVMLLEGITYRDAVKKVDSPTNIPRPESKSKTDSRLDSKAIPFPEYSRTIIGSIPYCDSRGISVEDIQSFGLFYCDGGRYRNRLIFPVWEKGRLIFYQGRAMWEPKPGENFIKSLNPPKTDGSSGTEETLFNLEYAKYYPRVVITEGPIDAIHVGRKAVCTWGKHITDTQILKLYYAGVRAVDLMWDGPTDDEPYGAYPEMVQAIQRLSGLFDVQVVFLPEGDPGQYSRNDLNTFLKSAKRGNEISNLGFL